MIEGPSTVSPVNSKSILDVGCGQNKFAGAIGIDSNLRSHADVIHDLGVFPYPFENDQFDLVICRHVIEHVPDVMGFVTELHRITKPGGRLKIVTPHYSNLIGQPIRHIETTLIATHSSASFQAKLRFRFTRKLSFDRSPPM